MLRLADVAGDAEEWTSSPDVPLGAAIWEHMTALVAGGSRRIHLQWVPAHCELGDNARVDAIAKEAAALPQEDVPVDVGTVCPTSRTVRGGRRTAGRAGGISD